MRTFLLISSMAMALLGASCGDDGGDGDTGGQGGNGAAAACFDYASFDGSSPAVNFKAEVLPIFQRSCGVGGASCHGAESGSSGYAYLGPAMGTEASEAQLAAILAQNVGVASTIQSGMNRITAREPQNSFLMHKIDNTLKCADLECAPASCLGPMPAGAPTLPAEERDTIRRWIAQGAEIN